MSPDEDPPPLLEFCLECRARVSYETVFVHEREAPDGEPEEYTLAVCSLCGEPSLFYREALDIQRDILEIDHPDHLLLYPTSPRVVDAALPDDVARSYSEACHAEFLELPMSSAVMIGRALEATCRHFDPASRSLFDGLGRMKATGVLSDEMYEWATELRILRNEAAHATAFDVAERDVCEALDFLQALLEIIFEIRPRFQRFKQRRNGA